MPLRRCLLVLLLVALAATALAPAASAQARSGACNPPNQAGVTDPRGVDPASPNPIAGLPLYVDRREPAYQLFKRFRKRGQRGRAAAIARLAGQPRFRWFGRWTRPGLQAKTRRYLRGALCRRQRVPEIVVMRHQGKECRPGYLAGGRREDRRARRWYRGFAKAVGRARVIIGFEPDGLGTLECLAPHRRRARLKLLRYGVDVLSKLPNATIYLEGGASDWESARTTARKLRFIGIRKVRGFMLNATHLDWTANNIRFGRQVSRMTGGKPFVVSTAYNGRGPVHVRRRIGGRTRRLNVWCHPLKRGLGPAPTTVTGRNGVDAFLWIGRPGYSAGACNGGPLPVGRFWPRRALMFARYATGWLSPPRGTRNGHRRRFSPRSLGFCGLRCS